VVYGVVTSTISSTRPALEYAVYALEFTPDSSKVLEPVGKGTQIFYMQSNKLIMRSFEYDLQADGYIPVDRNTIADHITRSGIKQIEVQEGRPNIVWGVREDGKLIGMTFEDAETVSGFHKHTTSGDVTSIARLPRDGEYDQLWQVCKRTVDGTDNYYVEYYADEVIFDLRSDYNTGDKEEDDRMYRNKMFEDQKQYIHVDSSLSYYGDDNAVTMTPAATTGTGITFTAGGAFFDATMVGREIWRKSVTGAETGRAEITGYTNSTTVTCTILEAFDSTSAIPATEWYLTTDTVSGLEHLEGEEVTICVDGGQHPQETVTDGEITLDRQASIVHVGLGYTGYLESNELEGGGTNGTAQTKRKNMFAVGVRFLDTLYAKYGTSYYTLNQIEMRKPSMAMDRPPLMFTGDRKETYANEINDEDDAGWARSKRVIIAQDQPFPCNVQLLVPYFAVSN